MYFLYSLLLSSHSQQHGNVQVIFKDATKIHFFVGAKPLKLKVRKNNILQSHYPPSGNVQVILLKFKMATTSRLFKYL